MRGVMLLVDLNGVACTWGQQTTLGGVKAESFAGDLWETKRTDPSIGADHLPEDISVCIILLWISIPLEGKEISATNEQF